MVNRAGFKWVNCCSVGEAGAGIYTYWSERAKLGTSASELDTKASPQQARNEKGSLHPEPNPVAGSL